jgi:hypothetical protein
VGVSSLARQGSRRAAFFGLPGALFYFGLLRLHRRLQAAKQRRVQ